MMTAIKKPDPDWGKMIAAINHDSDDGKIL